MFSLSNLSSSSSLSKSKDKRVGRLKASHAKVRTGCIRCKQRRVKCDETRPACLRCTKIDRACPGYQKVEIKVFGLTVNEGFTCELEKRCFDLFFFGGSARLAVFQPSSRHFWVSLLPQLCQIYSPLRHAVIALALVNEPLFMPEIDAAAGSKQPDILKSVTQHFNRSIQIFAKQVHTLSIEAKLSCCFVFTALVIYLYRVAASSAHIGAAYRFLGDYKQQVELGNVLSEPALDGTLVPILKRLFIDAATFSDVLTNASPFTPYENWMYELLDIPPVFPTVEAAYETLSNLLKYAIALLLGHIVPNSKPHLHLLSSLESFKAALQISPLNAYDASNLPHGDVGFYCKDLMMHHRVAQILCRCTPETMEHSLSAYAAEFQCVLQEVSALINREPSDTWRIALGWVPPLFLIATRCRVVKIRREALRLLHGLQRIERGWTSCIAHALARFVVNKEEALEAADPNPTSLTYVRLLSAQFQPDKAIVLIKYEEQIDQKRAGIITEEIELQFPANSLVGASGVQLPDYVLQASGYTGITMLTPKIACHCSHEANALNQGGEAVMQGSIEEIVIWAAGTRIASKRRT